VEYFLTDLLVLGAINGIMLVGLNMQYGYTGLLNFAFYTYVAIGAYVAGVTTMGHPTVPLVSYILQWSLPWYLGLLLSGVVAALLAVVVFSFTIRRLRSDYLGIVTVAVAFIFWTVINDYIPLFDGATGLYNVPYVTGDANLSSEQYSLILAALCLAVLAASVWLSRRIFRSPYGRVLRAIREDEVVASAFGRSIWRPQLWVFVIGNFIAGIAGGLFIFYITAWSPAAFQPLETFALMGALIIGGSGNYWGALLGAFVVLEGLYEVSRYLPTLGHPEWTGSVRLIVIGILMLLVLRYRPEGLIPERWLRWYRLRPATRPIPEPAGLDR
jgi:branched-chain amino acid transport system permease protein